MSNIEETTRTRHLDIVRLDSGVIKIDKFNESEEDLLASGSEDENEDILNKLHSPLLLASRQQSITLNKIQQTPQ